MGFIRAGFTGGFLGIVISIADIFVNSRILEKMSSIGFYLASSFGKVCINTISNECTLAEKFTNILASIVGNCIAYFIIFAILSLALSIIKMWFKPGSPEVKEQPAPVQVVVKEPEKVEVNEVVKESRPVKKAKVRKVKK